MMVFASIDDEYFISLNDVILFHSSYTTFAGASSSASASGTIDDNSSIWREEIGNHSHSS
jgi:hypothetical protein